MKLIAPVMMSIMSTFVIGTTAAAQPAPASAGPPPATSTPPSKAVVDGLAKKHARSDAAKAKSACRKSTAPHKKC